MTTQVLTFLIADIRGYTSYTHQWGDEAAARLAARFAELTEEVVVADGGEVVELRGDEALAVFTSARQALRSAIALQARFIKESRPDLPLQVRIGLDAGDAVPVKGGYRSGALNLAARLQAIAQPGEVLLSETVASLARKIDDLVYLDRGTAQLKGLPEPVRVVQVVSEDAVPAEAPKFTAHPTYPTNLPRQPTSFIGRVREAAAVREILGRTDVYLVTLTGPGGAGKTRLALRVGEDLLETFPDGVFLVSYASIADPSLFLSAIATALHIKEAGQQSLLLTLQAALGERRMLLLLDNLEHLIEAAPLLAELLSSAPGLKVLATSRSVLHLAGEHDYDVRPFSLPDPTNPPNLDALRQYDVVALFAQRARAVRADFAVTDDNAQAIAQICSRLDGLPLAIELAAARIRLVPPAALLARLSSRLHLLTGGAKDLPAKQQTLRAAIDWSFTLLSEAEQRLYARLSVFSGGCTLEAAEAVCATGEDLDVIDDMSSLVEKSLVRQEGEFEPRFVMLQTLQEHATERLAERKETESIRLRHAEYFLHLAETAEPEMNGPRQAEWCDRLEIEHDNLRMALNTWLEHNDVEQEMRLSGALWRFYQVRGYFSEGRQWLDIGLSRDLKISSVVRMRALGSASALAMVQGDRARAREHAEMLLALGREQENVRFERWALTLLGLTALQGGDVARAIPYLEEGLSLARASGTRHELAQALYNTALARGERGEYVTATELVGEAQAVFQEIGDASFSMQASGSLAYIALLSGEYARAQGLLRQYLESAVQLHDSANIAAAFEGLAVVAVEEAEWQRSARLFGAAAILRDRMQGRLMSARNQGRIEQAIDLGRNSAEKNLWQTAWNEGRAWPLEETVAYALREEERA